MIGVWFSKWGDPTLNVGFTAQKTEDWDRTESLRGSQKRTGAGFSQMLPLLLLS